MKSINEVDSIVIVYIIFILQDIDNNYVYASFFFDTLLEYPAARAANSKVYRSSEDKESCASAVPAPRRAPALSR
ncbi:MAG: hypothetical protein ABI846_04910 [Rudaea sp.]